MKTLDEVIEDAETLSEWNHKCDNCQWEKEHFVCGRDQCVYYDALHYLKEYQRYQKTPSRNGHMALVDYFEESQKNEPLTMEYFSKQIDTEPIWCEKLGEWYLFLAYDDGENEIQLMSDKGDIETFDEEDLEKYPLYRRK